MGSPERAGSLRDHAARSLYAFWRKGVQMCRQIIGVPDYDTYIAHLRMHHPERSIPTYAEFFAERQQARYRGGGGRCC